MFTLREKSNRSWPRVLARRKTENSAFAFAGHLAAKNDEPVRIYDHDDKRIATVMPWGDVRR